MSKAAALGGDYFKSVQEETQHDTRPGQAWTLESNAEAQAIVAQACLQAKGKIPVPHSEEAHAVAIGDRDAYDLPCVYVSAGFESLTGYSAAEALGRNCQFLQVPSQMTPGHPLAPLPAYNGYDEKCTSLAKTIQDGRADHITIINYHKSGYAFLNGLALVPVEWAGARYYVFFSTDITPQRGVTDKEQVSEPEDRSVLLSKETKPWADCETLGLDGLRPFLGAKSARNQSSSLTSMFPTKMNETESWLSLDRGLTGPDAALSILMKSSEQVVYVVSLSLEINLVSKGAKSLLEGTPCNIRGSSLLDIIHPQDATAVQAQLRKLKPGGVCDIICRVVRPFYEPEYVDFHVSRVSSVSRDPSYMVLYGRTISPLLLSTRSLADERLSPHPPMWAKISKSGIILFVTSALKSLFRCHLSSQEPPRESDIVGLSFQSLLCQHSRTCFVDALATIIEARTEMTTVRHCFGCPGGGKMAMISDLMLSEPHSATQANGHVTFILVRMQHAADGGMCSSSSSSQPFSQRFVRKSPHDDCGQSCFARHDSSSSLAPAKSEKGNATRSRTTPTWPHTTTITKASTTSTESRTLSALTTSIVQLPPRGEEVLGADRLLQTCPPSGSDTTPFYQPDGNMSWQYNVHSLIRANAQLKKDIEDLQAQRSKRQRREARARQCGATNCANCYTTDTPEWRRGPSGERNLCNRCGLRYFKDKERQRQQQKQVQSMPKLSTVPTATIGEGVSEDDTCSVDGDAPQDDGIFVGDGENEDDDEDGDK